MNVKEIAESVGKDERSVQRWIKRTADKVTSIAVKMSAGGHGKITDYDFDETLSIIETGLGKNAAKIWRENGERSTLSNVHGLPVPNDKGIIQAGSSLTEKDIHLISAVVSMTVSETIKRLDGRMSAIEDKIGTRAALLPAPEMKPRDHINKLVREYSHAKGITFTEAWLRLYREFGYRTNSNPSLSAKNRGMTIIDYIEAEGQIETLESVAMETCA